MIWEWVFKVKCLSGLIKKVDINLTLTAKSDLSDHVAKNKKVFIQIIICQTVQK